MSTTEPLLGWRIWRVVDDRICAVVWGTPWQPRERFEAQCRSEPSTFWIAERLPPAHGTPGAACECGIYAFKTQTEAALLAQEKVDHDVIALGRVSLWGRVLEGERGYRSQYAYPYNLVLLGGSERLARTLRGLYAVDVDWAPAVAQLHAGTG